MMIQGTKQTSSRRKRVGILAHTQMVSATPDGDALAHFVAAVPYIKAVEKSGALPIVLPVCALGAIDELLDAVYALVITGGVDVDPASYNASPDAMLGEVSAERDAIDIAVALAVVARNVPTLAVCRGIQIMNVALGGTLVQHVDGHMRVDMYNQLIHRVTVTQGSRLATIVDTFDLGVNSLHHQVLDQLGEGVVVAAHNEDGHVEAITIDGAPNVMAVQWHPELLRHDPQHLALFTALVI